MFLMFFICCFLFRDRRLSLYGVMNWLQKGLNKFHTGPSLGVFSRGMPPPFLLLWCGKLLQGQRSVYSDNVWFCYLGSLQYLDRNFFRKIKIFKRFLFLTIWIILTSISIHFPRQTILILQNIFLHPRFLMQWKIWSLRVGLLKSFPRQTYL